MRTHYEPHRCMTTEKLDYCYGTEREFITAEFTNDPEDVTCCVCSSWLKKNRVPSRSDLAHIAETACGLRDGQLACEHCGDGFCESDCYASETIMTSLGYMEVSYNSDTEAGEAGGVTVEL